MGVGGFVGSGLGVYVVYGVYVGYGVGITSLAPAEHPVNTRMNIKLSVM